MLRKLLDLLSDASIYGLSTVSGQIISFLLLPLYTRYLSPADYGVLAMLTVAQMLLQGLAPLGVTNAIFRRLCLTNDQSEHRRELSTAFWSVIGSASIFFISGVIFSNAISRLLIGSDSGQQLVTLCLLTASIAVVSEMPRCALRAQRRVRVLALVSILKIVVTLCLTIVAVVVLRKGVLGYLQAGLLSEILFLPLYLAPVSRYFGAAWSTVAWRSMLAYGWPILPHSVLAIVTLMFGQYTVRKMLGLEQAGLYDMANKFTMPLAVLVNAFHSAWQPYKFRIHKGDQDPTAFFRSILTYYVALAACLWVLASFWLPYVLRIMTAPAFHPAVTIIPIVLLAQIVRGVYFMLGSGIELSDDTRPMAFVSGTGLITVVACSYLLIPVIGARGAGYANAICWATMAAAAWKLANLRMTINYEWRTIAILAILSSGFVGLGIYVQQSDSWTRWISMGTLSILFPFVVFVTLIMFSAEAERLRRRSRLVIHDLRSRLLLERSPGFSLHGGYRVNDGKFEHSSAVDLPTQTMSKN